MKSLAKRWWFWLLIVVIAGVVVVHTYGAIWVRDYVNRKLSEIPGYRAHVASVTLHLWRGAYQIHNIDIKKTSGRVPVPFFAAPHDRLTRTDVDALVINGRAAPADFVGSASLIGADAVMLKIDCPLHKSPCRERSPATLTIATCSRVAGVVSE